MASTRWLLVLMLWLLPWLQMVKSGFSVQRFANVANWNPTVIIPKDGIYLISVIADPCKGCVLTVQVSCKCHGGERFIVIAIADRIYSHAEVAAGLKKNDKLFLKIRGKVEEASSLSVVYVAAPPGFYYTAKNDIKTENNPVTYTTKLTPNGWSKLKNANKVTTFVILKTGMYWVTARVNPLSKTIIEAVQRGTVLKRESDNLFLIYAEKGKAVSASGAFRLKAGITVWTVTEGGIYEAQTLLSILYLSGNKKPNTYPFQHLAFTAKYDGNRYSAAQEVLQFKQLQTHFGYIHLDGYTEIRRTGSYMISVRPDPQSATIVIMTLYVNGTFRWGLYAEEGVPVGATISLSLQAGSYLEVRSRTATTLGSGTMFSVAFIQP